jgi:hypothetical protein
MQVNFEPDWDYMLEKSCDFYARIPYKNLNTGYTYADYMDSNIEKFLGINPAEVSVVESKGKQIKLTNPHQMGLGSLIVARFEWRWEYRGPRHFPRGAKSCVEWNLREQKAYITNLSNNVKPIFVVQPEEVWFCAYGTKSYEEIVDFWRKTWKVRTVND